MALTTKLSNAAVNAQLDALAKQCDGGTLKIFTGNQPAIADGPTTGLLLVTIALGSPAFNAAINGVISAKTVIAEDAVDTGTAGWFRISTSRGVALWDGSVGTSGCNLNLNSVNITIRARVEITELSHSFPKQGLTAPG